eukprot:s7447_g5.t1
MLLKVQGSFKQRLGPRVLESPERFKTPSAKGVFNDHGPALFAALGVNDSASFWRCQIEAIYRRRNPHKLSNVEALLEKYKDKEAVLYAKVCKARSLSRNGIAAGPGAADAAIVNDMMMNHARFLDLDPHRDFYLPDLVRALVRVQDQRSDLLPIFVS